MVYITLLKISTITSKAFLPLYSFSSDTVCMTLFVVPILACLLPFWPSPLTNLWVPMSANRANTHCQSFFFVKKAGSVPSGLMSPISQAVSPLLPNVPVYMFHFGLPSDGKRWRGERVCDNNWSCLVILTDNWWRRMFWCPSPESWTQKGLNDENYIIQKHTETSVWSHKWRFKDVFNQGLMGATAESFHCSSFHCSPQHSASDIQVLFFIGGQKCTIYSTCVLLFHLNFLYLTPASHNKEDLKCLFVRPKASTRIIHVNFFQLQKVYSLCRNIYLEKFFILFVKHQYKSELGCPTCVRLWKLCKGSTSPLCQSRC